MTGSVAIDVVIGLVFIYLLYSLLATIVQEAIANMFGFRAKFLQKAIIRMLEDGKANVATNYWNNLKSFFAIFGKKKDLGHLKLTKAFYDHPLIKYLAEDDYHNKPSYLTAQNFSKTLIDLLRGNSFEAGDNPKLVIEKALKEKKIQWKNVNDSSDVPINPETLNYLRSLWADSQGDVNKFRSLIEEWFDVTMERTTGWYKKHAHGVLLMIGLFIAIFFNVDTLKIVDRLSNDPVLREQIVKQADNYIKTHEVEIRQADSSKNPTLDQIKKKADSLMTVAHELVSKDIAGVNQSLAIGWACHCNHELKNKCDSTKCVHKPKIKCSEICIRSNFGFSSLIGWFVTACALSLGAPFWFDLLNKLMKLRGTINSGEKERERAKTDNTKNINPKG